MRCHICGGEERLSGRERRWFPVILTVENFHVLPARKHREHAEADARSFATEIAHLARHLGRPEPRLLDHFAERACSSRCARRKYPHRDDRCDYCGTTVWDAVAGRTTPHECRSPS